MKHKAPVAVVTAIVAALAGLALLTAAAPAAPRWPAATLAWWQEAQPHLDAVETAVTDAWAAYPADPDTIQTAAETIAAAVDALAELDDPPPALLPVQVRLAAAAAECDHTISYAADLAGSDQATSAFAIGILTGMRNQCSGAITEARVEAARYASTVGGYPEPAK